MRRRRHSTALRKASRLQFSRRWTLLRLDVGDVEASFQDQCVIAVELDGISAGLGKDETDQVEAQLEDRVNIGELDVALDLGPR